MRGTCPVQETIKVRERIPHIGLIPQDNPSKLLLDQVLLARCVDVLCRFVSKRRKTFNAVEKTCFVAEK